MKESGQCALLAIAMFIACCLFISAAGVALAGDSTPVEKSIAIKQSTVDRQLGQDDGGDGDTTVMFFLLIGGTFMAVIVPAIIVLVIFMSWVAIDHNSLQKLRSAGSLKKLRRIVVTPQEWWAIGEDDSGFRKELEQAGVKVRIQQVENNSPTINKLLIWEKLDLPAAQAIEVAKVRGLKYVWLDGERVKSKDILNKIINPE